MNARNTIARWSLPLALLSACGSSKNDTSTADPTATEPSTALGDAAAPPSATGGASSLTDNGQAGSAVTPTDSSSASGQEGQNPDQLPAGGAGSGDPSETVGGGSGDDGSGDDGSGDDGSGDTTTQDGASGSDMLPADGSLLPLPNDTPAGTDPDCNLTPPAQPTIVSPVNGSEGLSRSTFQIESSAFADADGDTLLRTEFELLQEDALDALSVIWRSGDQTTLSLSLADGIFSIIGDTALQFDRKYFLRARHHDSSACNSFSDWGPAVELRTEDGADDFYNPEIVRRIDLTIPTDNVVPASEGEAARSSWEAVNDEAPAPGCIAFSRNYYPGSVTFEGATYPNAGLRIKGGCGSSRDLDEKASFKVNLVWDNNEADAVCPKKRRIYGKKRITLNGGQQDGSALHEHLTFQLYRAAGVPAPRTSIIQVYVNGEYYGVYQNIETIDRSMLKHWFDVAGGKGMMYEGSYNCDFLGGTNDPLEDGQCWEREFELDSCDNDPDPLDDLQQFEADGVTPYDPWGLAKTLESSLDAIQAPGSYYPAITELVDWQPFLKNWAISSIVVDWDNYVHYHNNFRFYHDPNNDLWYFIPWGVDQTWADKNSFGGGGFGGGGFGGGGGNTNDSQAFALFEADGDVARLCLEATGTDASGTCRDSYVAALRNGLTLFESFDWSAEIDAWVARLDPLMQLEDDRKTYTYARWQDSVEAVRTWAVARAEALHAEIDAAEMQLIEGDDETTP